MTNTPLAEPLTSAIYTDQRNSASPTEKRISYKLQEAAELLGVSVPSLRRAIARGLLKPSRAFRHVLIGAEELRRFIESTTYSSEG